MGNGDARDIVIWHYSRNGMFSVKSCYHLIRNSEVPTAYSAESLGAESGGRVAELEVDMEYLVTSKNQKVSIESLS